MFRLARTHRDPIGTAVSSLLFDEALFKCLTTKIECVIDNTSFPVFLTAILGSIWRDSGDVPPPQVPGKYDHFFDAGRITFDAVRCLRRL